MRDVAALEGELAQLALDLGAVAWLVGQRAGALEVPGRLVVAAAQHQDVAEALGDRSAVVASSASAAARSAIRYCCSATSSAWRERARSAAASAYGSARSAAPAASKW